MKKFLLVAVASVVLASGGAAVAQAKKRSADKSGERVESDVPVKANGGVFKCVDRDGNITYGNVGDVKGCKRIETDAVNSVPFPRAAAPAARSGTAAKNEGGAQRARDTDRRRILQEELSSEEKKLVELRKEFNSGEPERRGDEKNYQKYLDRSEKLKADVTRSESNVESLRRELANIKD